MEYRQRSACHDCQLIKTWDATSLEEAKEKHKEFHVGHETEIGEKYDYDFLDKTYEYTNIFEDYEY